TSSWSCESVSSLAVNRERHRGASRTVSRLHESNGVRATTSTARGRGSQQPTNSKARVCHRRQAVYAAGGDDESADVTVHLETSRGPERGPCRKLSNYNLLLVK